MGWGLIKKVEISYKHLKLLNPAIPPLNRTTRKHRLTQDCIAKIRDIGCLMCQILIDPIFYRYRYFAKFAYQYQYFKNGRMDIDINIDIYQIVLIYIDMFQISLSIFLSISIFSKKSYQYFQQQIINIFSILIFSN